MRKSGKMGEVLAASRPEAAAKEESKWRRNEQSGQAERAGWEQAVACW